MGTVATGLTAASTSGKAGVEYPRGTVLMEYSNCVLGEPSPAEFEMHTKSCLPIPRCQCPLSRTFSLFGITICNPFIIPAWILAVVIGVHAGSTIFRSHVPGYIAYAVPFFTYAVMIS